MDVLVRCFLFFVVALARFGLRPVVTQFFRFDSGQIAFFVTNSADWICSRFHLFIFNTSTVELFRPSDALGFALDLGLCSFPDFNAFYNFLMRILLRSMDVEYSS